MKIAIDGPSAGGKGTVAKMLAKMLAIPYLSTGKLYRIVALCAAKAGDNLEKEALNAALNIERNFFLEADNKNIYTEQTAALASKIAQVPQIRTALLQFQKDFANSASGAILEGRDIGTVILPDADFKFYLDNNII